MSSSGGDIFTVVMEHVKNRPNEQFAILYDSAYLSHRHDWAYDYANAAIAWWEQVGQEMAELGADIEGPSLEDWRALQAQASTDMLQSR